MKHNSLISYGALLMACFGAVAPCVSHAVRVTGVNTGRSYAGAYNQVNAMRANAAAATTTTNPSVNVAPAGGMISGQSGANVAIDGTGTPVQLPVRVADTTFANSIARGETVDNVNMATLERCARIYPNGEMEWGVPTAGYRGGAAGCVAVVTLKTTVGDSVGGEPMVLARATVAAGDEIRCNISDFPESGYTPDVEKVQFPSDRAPTIDDVVSVLNAEQKQNAGLKIVAGVVIGGLSGNVMGKNDRGDDGIIGTSSGKMQGTLVGALSGAAMMAGNAYTGKVAGDVILHTGVNAAAGAVIGNMMAPNTTMVLVEDCETPDGQKTKCVWGTVVRVSDQTIDVDGEYKYYYGINNERIIKCKKDDTPNSAMYGKEMCENAGRLADIKIDKYSLSHLKQSGFREVTEESMQKYMLVNKELKAFVDGDPDGGDTAFVEISSAKEPVGFDVPAMVTGFDQGAFGSSTADFYKWAAANPGATVYGRDGKGAAYNLSTDGDNNAIYTIDHFTPRTVNSSDGDLIDITNRGRLKGTLTGAGVGGALGGLSGYQGAQKDINDRWLAATDEYKNSLQKVYCETGTRFLGFYNDIIQINALPNE